MERLTEVEFYKLVKIQRKYLRIMLDSERKRYKLALGFLNQEEQEIIDSCKKRIVQDIDSKIQFFIDNNAWELGLIHINQLYWKANFSILLPFIYIHYRHLTLIALNTQFEGDTISEFLISKYPFLENSLENIHLIYCDMRKEYKKTKLSRKLGYGDDLPNPSYIPKGFALSTVRDLLREIRSFSLRKPKDTTRIFELHKQGKNQREIAEATNISQSTISRILNQKV